MTCCGPKIQHIALAVAWAWENVKSDEIFNSIFYLMAATQQLPARKKGEHNTESEREPI